MESCYTCPLGLMGAMLTTGQSSCLAIDLPAEVPGRRSHSPTAVPLYHQEGHC